MVNKTLVMLVVAPLGTLPLHAPVQFILDSAANFAVLGGTAVTNTGDTAVHGGHVGTSHSEDITGFPPGIVLSPHAKRMADDVARKAHIDLTAAYKAVQGMKPTHDLSGQDLGGLTLLPGVYYFSSLATLNGILTLDCQGNKKAQFVFQIGTTLTTGTKSAVISINRGNGSEPRNFVFWQVGSSATLGADSAFEGTILATTDIIIMNSASIQDGGALARHGAVTLDTNKIKSNPPRP